MAVAEVDKQAALFAGGGFTFGAAGTDGARTFRLRLAELDVPCPHTPSGLQAGYEYVLTSAAVEQWGQTIIGQPIRASNDRRDHNEYFLVNGQVKEVLAKPFGYFTGQEVVVEGDHKYWEAWGSWWPEEDLGVTDWLVNQQETVGGSYEAWVWYTTKAKRCEIYKFSATGAAALEKSSAAYGDLSDMIFAKAAAMVPHIAALPEGQRSAAIVRYKAAMVQAAAMSTLPLADPDWEYDSADMRQRLIEWCVEDGQVVFDRAEQVFLWHDGDGTARADWMFPIADVIDGEAKLVRSAIETAKWQVAYGSVWGWDCEKPLDLTDAEREDLLAKARQLLALFEDDAEAAQAAAYGGTPLMSMEDELRKALASATSAGEELGQAKAQVADLEKRQTAVETVLAKAGFENEDAVAGTKELAQALEAERALNAATTEALAGTEYATVADALAALKAAKDELAEAQTALQAANEENDKIVDAQVEARANKLFEALAADKPEAVHEVLRASAKALAADKTDAEVAEMVQAMAGDEEPGAPDGTATGRVMASREATGVSTYAEAKDEARKHGLSGAKRDRFVAKAVSKGLDAALKSVA